jgi:hypothetical protein
MMQNRERLKAAGQPSATSTGEPWRHSRSWLGYLPMMGWMATVLCILLITEIEKMNDGKALRCVSRCRFWSGSVAEWITAGLSVVRTPGRFLAVK